MARSSLSESWLKTEKLNMLSSLSCAFILSSYKSPLDYPTGWPREFIEQNISEELMPRYFLLTPHSPYPRVSRLHQGWEVVSGGWPSPPQSLHSLLESRLKSRLSWAWFSLRSVWYWKKSEHFALKKCGLLASQKIRILGQKKIRLQVVGTSYIVEYIDIVL